jgi:hypothetical protein
MKWKGSAQPVQSPFRMLAHNLALKLYIVDYNHNLFGNGRFSQVVLGAC